MEQSNLDKLTKFVKIEMNITNEEETIRYYLEKCEMAVIDYTGYNPLPYTFQSKLIELVVECLNTRGLEGYDSTSALGVSDKKSFNDIETSVRNKFKGKRNPKIFLG